MKRLGLVGLLLLIIGVVVALYFTAVAPTAATPAANSWPSMTLVYQVDGNYHGLSAATNTMVWKLSYQDVRHWRKELLRDTADPRAVGTVMSFQGTTYTLYSAVTKGTFTKQYPATDGPMVPEEWLVPGRERTLAGKGYQRAASADGKHIIYTKTETVPCQADNQGSGKKLTGVVQPASCASAPNFQRSETIVYRSDPTIPVEVTTQVEGMATQHAVVTGFTTP